MGTRALHRQLRQRRQAARSGERLELPGTAPAGRLESLADSPAGVEASSRSSDAAPACAGPCGPAAAFVASSNLSVAFAGPFDTAVPCALAARLEAIRIHHPKLHASLAELDGSQLAAVLSDSPSVLVRAPVGSGKTRVLVHRVVYLHRVCGIPLREMAVLTFTNRAAAEIRGRILALGDDGRPSANADLWLADTFHGAARALLSSVLPVEAIGYGRDFSVLDDDGCEEWLDRLISGHRLRIVERRRLRRRLRASDGVRLAGDDLPRLAALYADEKRAANTMDFDDLIEHATRLLARCRADRAGGAGPIICTGESNAPTRPGATDPIVRCVVVDEMQDCEPRDLAFLREVGVPQASFFAAGDPNQAIYGWRGTSPEVFSRAAAEFGCRMHELRVNYRSTRTILEGARIVLGLQTESLGRLASVRDFGERIALRRHHDPLSEALYLADRLAELHAGGVAYREIAVLFRLRAQAEVLCATLTARGVPCLRADDPPADAVRLLTLHAAKGLEFRHVFLSGINDGLVPLRWRRRSTDDAEERRLLFVGLTRARDGVEISYHARPDQAGATGEPSPYLRELPARLIDLSAPALPGQSGKTGTATLRLGDLSAHRIDTVPCLAPPCQSGATVETIPHLGDDLSAHRRDARDRRATPAMAPEHAPAPALRGAGAPEAKGRFSPGQTVSHPRYGAGVVVRVSESTVECDFGKRGARSFPLALCPLASIRERPT